MEAGNITLDEITTDLIHAHIEPMELSDPDLIILTGHQEKLENSLVWQCAYSELAFVEENWRQLTVERFNKILEQYMSRERRFGGLPAPTEP